MVEDEYAALPPDYCVLTPEIVEAVAARFPMPEFPRGESGVLEKAMAARCAALRAWVKQNTHKHRVPGYISLPFR